MPAGCRGAAGACRRAAGGSGLAALLAALLAACASAESFLCPFASLPRFSGTSGKPAAFAPSFALSRCLPVTSVHWCSDESSSVSNDMRSAGFLSSNTSEDAAAAAASRLSARDAFMDLPAGLLFAAGGFAAGAGTDAGAGEDSFPRGVDSVERGVVPPAFAFFPTFVGSVFFVDGAASGLVVVAAVPPCSDFRLGDAVAEAVGNRVGRAAASTPGSASALSAGEYCRVAALRPGGLAAAPEGSLLEVSGKISLLCLSSGVGVGADAKSSPSQLKSDAEGGRLAAAAPAPPSAEPLRLASQDASSPPPPPKPPLPTLLPGSIRGLLVLLLGPLAPRGEGALAAAAAPGPFALLLPGPPGLGCCAAGRGLDVELELFWDAVVSPKLVAAGGAGAAADGAEVAAAAPLAVPTPPPAARLLLEALLVASLVVVVDDCRCWCWLCERLRDQRKTLVRLSQRE
eukprot:1171329-Prorocentrum_minimum.AAC.8